MIWHLVMQTGVKCPYCLQPRRSLAGDPPHLSPSSREESIPQIRQRAQRLDDLIARLENERTSLRRQLNAARSPVNKLPPETLSHIFRYVCEVHPQDFGCSRPRPTQPTQRSYQTNITIAMAKVPDPRMVLGAVCAYWREVAWSYPYLWTTIELQLHRRNRSLCAFLLGLYLENSGNLPLSISLEFRPGTGAWIGSVGLVGPTVDPLLLQHQHRLAKLHLVNPSLVWTSYISQLPHLKELSLEPLENNNNDWELIVSSAQIRCITLSLGVPEEPTEQIISKVTLSPLSSNAISILNLVSIPINVCAELLLRQCPNLAEYQCTSPSYPTATQAPWLNKPTTLPHLEHFDWSCSRYKWATAIIEHIQMPSLRTLRWDEGFSRSASHDIKNAFFKRLPLSLTTIEFNGIQALRDSPLDHIRADLNIENLVFSECSNTFIAEALIKLTPKSRVRDALRFPMLGSITIGGEMENRGFRDLVEILGEDRVSETYLLEALFVEMLEARSVWGSDSSIQLIDDFGTLGWPSHLRKRLQKLVPGAKTLD